MELLVYVALAVGGTGVVWKGSEWLEASSERLATHYQLPPIVQGAVIAAVGSSFPELSSTVIATLLHGNFDLGVSAIVGSAIFNTPSFLWGLTVIAAATSLPDAFVSIRAAQRGEGTVSIANVLGSNIFDLLVAVPVGVLIAGTASIDYTVAAPMMGYLTFVTIVLFAMLRTRLVLARWEAGTLLMLYVAFVVWMVLKTAGLTAVVT